MDEPIGGLMLASVVMGLMGIAIVLNAVVAAVLRGVGRRLASLRAAGRGRRRGAVSAATGRRPAVAPVRAGAPRGPADGGRPSRRHPASSGGRREAAWR